MGLTIHYEGKAKSKDDINQVREFLEEIAKIKKWEFWKENDMYFGVNIDPGCESFAFEFDDNLNFREFCKTQYSKDFTNTHATICELLKAFNKIHFKKLEVFDEGHYYESGNSNVLQHLKEDNAKSINNFIGMLKKAGYKDNQIIKGSDL